MRPGSDRHHRASRRRLPSESGRDYRRRGSTSRPQCGRRPRSPRGGWVTSHAGVAAPGGRRGARDGADVRRAAGLHAGVRIFGADGRAVGRGPARRVGRDGYGGPRVDHPGHADEDEARPPGPAVRAGAGDPRRRADAWRKYIDQWRDLVSVRIKDPVEGADEESSFKATE